MTGAFFSPKCQTHSLHEPLFFFFFFWQSWSIGSFLSTSKLRQLLRTMLVCVWSYQQQKKIKKTIQSQRQTFFHILLCVILCKCCEYQVELFNKTWWICHWVNPKAKLWANWVGADKPGTRGWMLVSRVGVEV